MNFLLRTPALFVISIIANLFIFYFIMQLVTNENFRASKLEPVNLVDFIRLKEIVTPPDEIIQEQELEEPPPPEETPPPPEVPQPDIQKPDVAQLDIEIPNLNIPLNIDGTPFVGDFVRSEPNTSDALSTNIGQGIGGILTNIKPTIRIQPIYPRRAKRSKIEGKVVVEFTITKEGKVIDPVIVEATPPNVFERAVLKAIKRWQFNPQVRDGKAIDARARQNISFNLRDN